MGFLKRLFGISTSQKQEEKHEQKSFVESPISEPKKTELDLLERYAGMSFEKQVDFTELTNGKSWDADLSRGTITFGDDLEFPLQIIGSFSYSVDTWLWAWANTQSNLPAELITDAQELKAYGSKYKIDQLRTAEFPFNQEDLHRLGLIAMGMFDADGYYFADYGSGIMLMTVKSNIIKMHRNDVHYRIFTTFPQVISNFEVDHRNTLIAYLKDKGYQIEEQENQIIGSKDNEKCVASLDSSNRVINLHG